MATRALRTDHAPFRENGRHVAAGLWGYLQWNARGGYYGNSGNACGLGSRILASAWQMLHRAFQVLVLAGPVAPAGALCVDQTAQAAAAPPLAGLVPLIGPEALGGRRPGAMEAGNPCYPCFDLPAGFVCTGTRPEPIPAGVNGVTSPGLPGCGTAGTGQGSWTSH